MDLNHLGFSDIFFTGLFFFLGYNFIPMLMGFYNHLQGVKAVKEVLRSWRESVIKSSSTLAYSMSDEGMRCKFCNNITTNAEDIRRHYCPFCKQVLQPEER